MKKIIAFDMDDTLSVTKSPISDKMSELFIKLLEKYEVCIISGGNLDQFKKQVVDRLEVNPVALSRLHLMPTCGTRYYRYESDGNHWVKQYSEDLTEKQKERIKTVLTEAAKDLGLWPEKPHGQIIEDRGSQMTYSALGQNAPAEEKYNWDPDGAKKWSIRDRVAPLLPDVEVRVGGTTSVDVTRIGIDKAYGMQKLVDVLSISKEDVLFVGDKLQEGGNDYPVKAMGIDCIAVERWEDTALVIEALIKVV